VKSMLPRAITFSLLSVLLACSNSERIPISSAVMSSPAKPRPIPLMAQAQADHTNLMGMNVDTPVDYSTTRMFADAMKQSRLWQKPGGKQPALIDARGWPQEDAELAVWQGIGRMQGTYRLSFNGQAEVRISCCSGRLQNLAYSTSTNTTTADLIYPSSGPEGLFLVFEKTKRSPSGQGHGITNVKLMRPITEGGTLTYPPATLFTTPFKTALRRFKVLRFMDFLATNSNGQRHWSDRLMPDWYSMNQAAPGYGWQGRGGAYEYAISLCNELKIDCWLNVPVLADDDYIQHLALLVKSQLDPGLKLYLEYSNELWNASPGFAQAEQNRDLAKVEVAQGQSPLNFDGETNDWYWAWRRAGKRSAEISLIFRQLFGNGAMMQRIRPVLMTQLGYADGPLLQALHFMEGYYNNPAQVRSPKPPNYYFYGIGGSGYYNPKSTASPDAAFADFSDRIRWTAALQQDANYAAAFGLKRIAYEGGPSLEAPITDQTRPAYRNDPRIKPNMMNVHDLWSAQGGDLMMYFTITGESAWGFVPDIWDAVNPQKNLKLQAIDSLSARPRAAVKYGTLLPAALDAQKFSIPPNNFADRRSGQIKPGQWFGYAARTNQPGVFQISLQASADQASQIEVWINGALLGLLDIPKRSLLGGATQTQPLSMRLEPGVQGILLRGKTGVVDVSQILVTQSRGK
jgi:hypothetical protein